MRPSREIGLSHRLRRKPNGITKADRNARKSEDLLKRNFRAEKPLKKCVTDITEIPAKDGKFYVSAIFDCYDLGVLGLAMADSMKAGLCVSTVKMHIRRFRLSAAQLCIATAGANTQALLTGQSLADAGSYRA